MPHALPRVLTHEQWVQCGDDHIVRIINVQEDFHLWYGLVQAWVTHMLSIV